jgi:hypothetical protein
MRRSSTRGANVTRRRFVALANGERMGAVERGADSGASDEGDGDGMACNMEMSNDGGDILMSGGDPLKFPRVRSPLAAKVSSLGGDCVRSIISVSC